MRRKPKRPHHTKRVVFAYLETMTDVAPAVALSEGDLATLCEEELWNVFYKSALRCSGEEAKDRLVGTLNGCVRAKKVEQDNKRLKGKRNAIRKDFTAKGIRIESKLSGGKQQDNLCSSIGGCIWDHVGPFLDISSSRSRRSLKFYFLIPDPDCAVLVFIKHALDEMYEIEYPPDVTFTIYSDIECPKDKGIDKGEYGDSIVWKQSKMPEKEAVLAQLPAATAMQSGLLAYTHRKDIMGTIANHKAVVLVGPTGCGKSTIVPFLVRLVQKLSSIEGKVLVAQPRRLPVTQLCARVKQVGEAVEGALHSETSYRIGMDDRTTARTTLEFTTYGCLVKMLARNPRLEGYSHVFLDEIHERQLDMDLAISLLMPEVASEDGSLKLILMSATCSVAPLREHLKQPLEAEKNALETSEQVSPKDFRVLQLAHALPTDEERHLSEESNDVTYLPDKSNEKQHTKHISYLYDILGHIPPCNVPLHPNPGLLISAIHDVAAARDTPLYYLRSGLQQEALAVCTKVKDGRAEHVFSLSDKWPELTLEVSGKDAGEHRRKEFCNEVCMEGDAILQEEAAAFALFVLASGAEVHAVLKRVGDVDTLRAAKYLCPGFRRPSDSHSDGQTLFFPAVHNALLIESDALLTQDARLHIAVKLAIWVFENPRPDHGKHILVFLPGLAQIRRVERELRRRLRRGNHEIHILHSRLPLTVQERVNTESNAVKIILATNAAESSLTIKAVGTVIDCCLGRFEKEEHVVITERSSRDAATQRAGRTGRVCDGRVFRLITEFEWYLLSEYRNPEIFARGLAGPMRTLLAAQSFTSVKGSYSVKEILRRTIFKAVKHHYQKRGEANPEEYMIEAGAAKLVLEGALEAVDGVPVEEEKGDGLDVTYRLTKLGRLQAALPVSWEWAHFIYIGTKLGIEQECAVAAALCATSSVLYDENDASGQRTFLDFCGGTYSDPIACIEIMNLFLHSSKFGIENEEQWDVGEVRVNRSGVLLAKQTAESILSTMERQHGRRMKTKLKEGPPLSAEKKRLVLLAWATSFQQHICRFRPSEQPTRRLNEVRFNNDDLKRRSIVVIEPSHTEQDGLKALYHFLSVKKETDTDRGPDTVSTRRLDNEDWVHKEAPRIGSDLTFNLVTFKPTQRTVFGLDLRVWLAEKYSANNDAVEVMGCARWRAHSELDKWVPYGNTALCDGSDAGPRVSLSGMCAPLLSTEPLLVFPSLLQEFRKTAEDRSLSSRNQFVVLPSDDGFVALLACLMTRTPVVRAFQYTQESCPVDDIPEDWTSLMVKNINVDCSAGSWVRSAAFKHVRHQFMCLPEVDDSERPGCSADGDSLVACVGLLLEAVGYEAKLGDYLADSKEHEEHLAAKRGATTCVPPMNFDYASDAKEFEADFDLDALWAEAA